MYIYMYIILFIWYDVTEDIYDCASQWNLSKSLVTLDANIDEELPEFVA